MTGRPCPIHSHINELAAFLLLCDDSCQITFFESLYLSSSARLPFRKSAVLLAFLIIFCHTLHIMELLLATLVVEHVVLGVRHHQLLLLLISHVHQELD